MLAYFVTGPFKGNIDILMISESKVHCFFFGFKVPFPLDPNRNGGGIILFVRCAVPAKVVSAYDRPRIESFSVELNFRKKEWQLNCFYNPKHNSIESHLDCLSKSIGSLSSKYDNVILQGDFNLCMEVSVMKILCEFYKLRKLIKAPTCFKNSENPTCIDLILTKKPFSFKSVYLIETALSDFHKIIVAPMKMHFPKMKPQIVDYRKYKNFHNKTFIS